MGFIEKKNLSKRKRITIYLNFDIKYDFFSNQVLINIKRIKN